KLHRIVSLVAKQSIWIVVAFQLFAVDGEDVVAHICIDSDFAEGRTIDVFFVLTGEDLRDAITTGLLVELETRSCQARPRTRRYLKITAFDVRVLDCQFGDHFADYVIEIRTVSNVLEEWFVLLS